MANIRIQSEIDVLSKHYGSNLWFCEFCKSFWFWQKKNVLDDHSVGMLRLRRQLDCCHCQTFKENAKKPQPNVELEEYLEEIVFFPNSPGEVVKDVKRYRLRIMPVI